MKSDPRVQPEERRLDPRTEDLLREVAVNPDSCLLRATRRELRDALERADYLGITSQVGLSSAERELLRTARAEVAYWLNVMCFKRLTEDEATRRFCTRLVEGDREHIPPSLDSTRAGLAGSIESAREFRALEAPIEVVLERLVVGDACQRANVLDLASASLRLHPTYQARNYAVQGEVADAGAGPSAVRSARGLVALALTSSEIAYSSALLGRARDLAFGAEAALAEYLVASACLPRHREFTVRALLMAIRSSNRSVALGLARELGACPASGDVLRAVSASIASNGARISRNAQVLAREIHSLVPPNLGSVIHALVSE